MTTTKYMLLVFCASAFAFVLPALIAFTDYSLHPTKSMNPACHICASAAVQMPERRTAPTQAYAVSKERWWERTDLSDVSVVLVYRENAKLLRDVLDTQLAAVALACAMPTYNANGINEPCLNAYMTLQVEVDTTMKTMVKHHYEVYEE